MPPFSPDKVTGAQYLITLWVHEEEGETPLFDFEDLELIVKVNTTDADISEPQKSEIIDGWQRQEYLITIPDLATITDPETIYITFENIGEENINIDDIRIQPVKSLSKTYVYDFRTRRLLAELDENHYTTFYEYDEDGKLIRVKKETERGIMTIQEGKYSTPKR